MRVTAAVLALALMLVIPSASSAEVRLLNLSGNNFSTDEPAAIGDELKIVAQLSPTQGNPPFALPNILSWTTEYTLHIKGLILATDPGQFERNYTGGTIELWSGTPNSPWTPTTPVSSIAPLNPAVVPSTFIDGTLLLRGNFSSFTILDWPLQFPGTFDTGTITNTDIDFVAGANLGDLQAQGIQNNWAWNGWFKVGASGPVPPGYGLLYGGKLENVLPTPVEPATWGQIKSVYRSN